jgi:hypothetical protein
MDIFINPPFWWFFCITSSMEETFNVSSAHCLTLADVLVDEITSRERVGRVEEILEQIKTWTTENQLLQIGVVLKKSGRQIIIGRVVQLNDTSLLIYVDDKKSVEHFRINEIDSIIPV